MGQCKCSVPSVEEEVSAQQFRAMDANKNNTACKIEMGDYVASHPEMWAMMSVNLNLGEDACRKTATRVAMELASGKVGPAALQSEITESQFHDFRTKYMLDGKGSQEFFHRCVFASFDADGNHAMDSKQLDAFLETFYKDGSIFAGDARLPPMQELKERILSNSETYAKTNRISFEEIRHVLRGNATTASSSSTGGSNHNKSIAGTAESFSEQTSRHTATSLSQQPQDNNNIQKKTSNRKKKPAQEAAPEKTPEPKIKPINLSPPSLEFKLTAGDEEIEEVPEHTPEVRPSLSSSLHEGKALSSPAPRKKKPRRSKSDLGDNRVRSRTGSPAAARRGGRRTASRSPGRTSGAQKGKRPSIGEFIEKTNASSHDVGRSKSPSKRGRKKNISTEEDDTPINVTTTGTTGDDKKKSRKKSKSPSVPKQ